MHLPAEPITPSPLPLSSTHGVLGTLTKSRQQPNHGMFTPAPTPPKSLRLEHTEVDLFSPPITTGIATVSRSVIPTAGPKGARAGLARSLSLLRNKPSTAGNDLADADQIAKYFKAHDTLRSIYPHEDKITYPTICTVGRQSAGKSSVLSALLRLELWCAQGIATHGPTLIASRTGEKFRAIIKVLLRSPRDGSTKVVDFGIIENPADVQKALGFVGDESRRADGGANDIRPWDYFKRMTEVDRAAYRDEAKGWVEITENIVSVMVTGPGRPQFDIYDLPGLKGNPKIERIVASYISQPQNLILLCLPGTARDSSSQDREIQLVSRYDPTGERTIGVLTFADEMSPDPAEPSTCISYIRGDSDDLGIKPQHSWWPVMGKSWHQRRANLSLDAVREKELELFNDEQWAKLQAEIGRKFGVAALAKKLEEVFAVKVRENYLITQKALREMNEEHNEWLSSNPAVDNPVGYLHDEIIFAFAEQLREKVHRANASGRLVDLHEKFEKDVINDVPDFLACTEGEATERPLKSWYERHGAKNDSREKVHMDSLLEMIRQNTSRRDPGEIDTQAIIQLHLDRYAAQWKKSAMTHLQLLWAEMETIQRAVARELCGNNMSLIELISGHLELLSNQYKNNTQQFIETMHRVLSAPPSQLRLQYHSFTKSSFDDSIKHFRTQYGSLSPNNFPRPGNVFIPSPTATSTSGGEPNANGVWSQNERFAPSSDSPRILDEISTPAEREQCFLLQAKLVTVLFSSATEFAQVVGQHAQYQLLEYVKEVSRTLRKGMRLEEVTPEVRKKAEGWVESDKEKKRERKRRIEELEKGQETERELAAAFSD